MPHPAFVVLALLALAAPASSQEPPQPQPPPQQQQPNPPAPVDVVAALETAIGDAIARAEASVVAIARVKDAKSEMTAAVRGRMAPLMVPRDPMDGFLILQNVDDLEGPDYVASDFGSGVVIGERGEVLTTFHVVKGASRLVVRAAGGKVFDAEVLAADPRSDLAVIAPREGPGTPRPVLRPITLGDGTKLRKGMFLIALGNPFNAGRDGKASASWGILANLARRVDSSQVEASVRQLRHYPTMLQLDAKLNLGMAGGAVINLKGEMVGLTTNAANVGGFDAQAGYALPIDALTRRAIEALRQGKEVEYGFLGVMLSPENTNQIRGVVAGTPAGEGGLMPMDEVTSIGGLPVVDSDSLVMSVNAFAPGEPITVKIRRGGVELEKTVVLSKLGMAGEVIATNRPMTWRGLRVDFVSTLPGVNHGEEILRAMAQGGVLVIEVQPRSPAAEAGLKVGQIIVKIEGRPIRNPADFAAAVEGLKGPTRLTTEGDRTVTIR